MAQTYKDIQAEAERRFGKKASREKFEWRRQQQAAAGLELEKKTRGGVAGAYDRNKKLVSAAATVAGFLAGGPAGAGLARGAVQGLDRPGEGGIGFDVKRGVKGFSEGYGAGKIAAIGKAGLSRLFAPGGAGAGAAAAPSIAERVGAGEALDEGGADIAGTSPASLPGTASEAAGGLRPMPPMVRNRMTDRFNIGPNTMRRPITSVPASFGALGAAGPSAGAAGAGGGGSFLGGLARGGANLAREAGGMLRNPQVLAGVAGGVADVMGQRSQQRIQEQQLGQQQQQFQQRFDVEEEERRRQQAQANRLAGMFMPRAQG